MLAEPVRGPHLPTSIVVTTTYGELHPGSFQVPICLRNLSTLPTLIPTKVIRKVTPGNWVPSVMPPMRTFGEFAHDPKKAEGWILDELDLQGLRHWPEKEQKQPRQLLVKWKHLFAHSNLDLGMISLIKHSIELTDRMPFKECYCQIPPHMYEDAWHLCHSEVVQPVGQHSHIGVQKGQKPEVLHWL